MDTDRNWEEHKEELKIKFAALTNTESFFSDDKKEELLNKYQLKLGKTRAELLIIFQSL